MLARGRGTSGTGPDLAERIERQASWPSTDRRERECRRHFTAGDRVRVLGGRRFQDFGAGDRGVVVHVDVEAGTCEVMFDGRAGAAPLQVAARHLGLEKHFAPKHSARDEARPRDARGDAGDMFFTPARGRRHASAGADSHQAKLRGDQPADLSPPSESKAEPLIFSECTMPPSPIWDAVSGTVTFGAGSKILSGSIQPELQWKPVAKLRHTDGPAALADLCEAKEPARMQRKLSDDFTGAVHASVSATATATAAATELAAQRLSYLSAQFDALDRRLGEQVQAVDAVQARVAELARVREDGRACPAELAGRMRALEDELAGRATCQEVQEVAQMQERSVKELLSQLEHRVEAYGRARAGGPPPLCTRHGGAAGAPPLEEELLHARAVGFDPLVERLDALSGELSSSMEELQRDTLKHTFSQWQQRFDVLATRMDKLEDLGGQLAPVQVRLAAVSEDALHRTNEFLRVEQCVNQAIGGQQRTLCEQGGLLDALRARVEGLRESLAAEAHARDEGIRCVEARCQQACREAAGAAPAAAQEAAAVVSACRGMLEQQLGAAVAGVRSDVERAVGEQRREEVRRRQEIEWAVQELRGDVDRLAGDLPRREARRSLPVPGEAGRPAPTVVRVRAAPARQPAALLKSVMLPASHPAAAAQPMETPPAPGPRVIEPVAAAARADAHPHRCAEPAPVPEGPSMGQDQFHDAEAYPSVPLVRPGRGASLGAAAAAGAAPLVWGTAPSWGGMSPLGSTRPTTPVTIVRTADAGSNPTPRLA